MLTSAPSITKQPEHPNIKTKKKSSVNPIRNYNPSLDDRPKASITLTIDQTTYPNIVTYLDSGNQINIFYGKDLEKFISAN